jgi:hypothetical protein
MVVGKYGGPPDHIRKREKSETEEEQADRVAVIVKVHRGQSDGLCLVFGECFQIGRGFNETQGNDFLLT